MCRLAYSLRRGIFFFHYSWQDNSSLHCRRTAVHDRFQRGLRHTSTRRLSLLCLLALLRECLCKLLLLLRLLFLLCLLILLRHLLRELREHLLHHEIRCVLRDLRVDKPLFRRHRKLDRKRRILEADSLVHVLILDHLKLHLLLRLLLRCLLSLLPPLFDFLFIRKIGEVKDDVKYHISRHAEVFDGINKPPHLRLPLRRARLRIADDDVKLPLRQVIECTMDRVAERVLLDNLLIDMNELLPVRALHAVYLVLRVVLRNDARLAALAPQ